MECALCQWRAVGLPVPIVVYGEKLVRQEECILIMDLETLVQVLQDLYRSHNPSQCTEYLDITRTKHPKIKHPSKDRQRHQDSRYESCQTGKSFLPETCYCSGKKWTQDPAVFYTHFVKIHDHRYTGDCQKQHFICNKNPSSLLIFDYKKMGSFRQNWRQEYQMISGESYYSPAFRPL